MHQVECQDVSDKVTILHVQLRSSTASILAYKCRMQNRKEEVVRPDEQLTLLGLASTQAQKAVLQDTALCSSMQTGGQFNGRPVSSSLTP